MTQVAFEGVESLGPPTRGPGYRSRGRAPVTHERSHLRHRPVPARSSACAHRQGPRPAGRPPVVAAAGRAPSWACTRACTTCASTSASRTGDGRASTPSSPGACAKARARSTPIRAAIVSPADGRIESMGPIDDGRHVPRQGPAVLRGRAGRRRARGPPLPGRGGLRRLPVAARLPPRARARGRHRPPHPLDARRLLPRQRHRRAPRGQPVLPQPPRRHRDRRRRGGSAASRS